MERTNILQRPNGKMHGRSKKDLKYISQDLVNVSFKQQTCNRGICKFPSIPYKFLCYTGLVEPSDQYFSYKIAKFFIILMFIFRFIFTWGSHIRRGYVRDFKAKFAKVTNFIMPVIIFYAMLRKRKLLTTTLSNLNGMPPYGKKINLFALLLCCMPFIYTVWVTVTCNQEEVAKHAVFGYDVESVPVQILLVSTKHFLSAILNSAFLNFVALVFCILCQRCCSLIEMLTQEIQRVPPETFGISRQIEAIRQKARIEYILENIQEIFSLPSFFIVIQNFLSCSEVIGFYLYTSSSTKKYAFRTLAQSFFYTLNSLGCLVLMIWVVGGVPIHIRKVKEAFRKKKRLRLIYACAREETPLHAEYFENSDFVFTGCDLISFRRSLILTIFGTLLTYAALLINWVRK
ncbi:uncharacterized protein TNIN_495061 [Trichonephila inaurata madagascariensis]|uniref:Uncharacterized protein n=1 Tax=Trichonephila inaurata madagascariensis TaxID=2747483 RepID=A0A8X7BPK9_9ARAC|nr:uncharacterized protein TNIN_495061 [Trichonephila inaurata madagascariensis]